MWEAHAAALRACRVLIGDWEEGMASAWRCHEAAEEALAGMVAEVGATSLYTLRVLSASLRSLGVFMQGS